MKVLRIAALLAAVVSGWGTTPAAGQVLDLYDDFSSGRLDRARWLGYEHTIGASQSRQAALYGTKDWTGYPAPQNEDSVRQVIGGRAQIALTTYRDDPERGVMGYFGSKARSGLRINHPALADHRPAVRALRATVTVVSASVPTMPDCEDGGEVRAEIFGHFFNDGTSTGTADLTGDVFARLQLQRRKGGAGNSVKASIGRCTNADCSVIRSLSTVMFTGVWSVGTPYVLTIAWQPASNAFGFSFADGGTTESRSVAYTMADQTAARAYAYDLRVETAPMLCWDGSFPDTVPHIVSIDARFDDVYLDRTAATAAR